MLDRSEVGKRGYLKENFRLFHLRDSRAQKLEYHYHEFDKLILLLSGKVTYVVEGKSYFLKPGDILICTNDNVTYAHTATYVGNVIMWATELEPFWMGIIVSVVIGIALVTFAVWLISGATIDFALSMGITVLVISCPCALGLATPVAIMAGTGKAAENGILIKSAEALENLSSVDTVVLDKTGTVTSGKMSVSDIFVLDKTFTEKEFLSFAYSLENGSEHPLANAIKEKAKSERKTFSFGLGSTTQVTEETTTTTTTVEEDNTVNV